MHSLYFSQSIAVDVHFLLWFFFCHYYSFYRIKYWIVVAVVIHFHYFIDILTTFLETIRNWTSLLCVRVVLFFFLLSSLLFFPSLLLLVLSFRTHVVYKTFLCNVSLFYQSFLLYTHIRLHSFVVRYESRTDIIHIHIE